MIYRIVWFHQVIFEAVVGTSYRGDIAIDDISFTPQCLVGGTTPGKIPELTRSTQNTYTRTIVRETSSGNPWWANLSRFVSTYYILTLFCWTFATTMWIFLGKYHFIPAWLHPFRLTVEHESLFATCLPLCRVVLLINLACNDSSKVGLFVKLRLASCPERPGLWKL